jgi:hypothetical protein
MNPRSIFLHEIEDTIAHPQDAEQLTAAIAAHRAYLAWDREQTTKKWRSFCKQYRKV